MITATKAEAFFLPFIIQAILPKTNSVKPGPASTVGERPLRKISFEGTVVRYSLQDDFSIPNLFRKKD